MSNNINEGIGEAFRGGMCERYTFYYPLLPPHINDFGCVGWAVKYLVIHINDRERSIDEVRAAGLSKLAIAQLGSEQLDQNRFAELVALKAIQRLCPPLLAEIAEIAVTDEDREDMESAGRACAEASSLQEAVTALVSAYGHALYIDFAQSLASALARAADSAQALCLGSYFGLDIALNLAIGRVETLNMLADICTEVLIEMESPGCQWLGLCEIKEVE